MKAFEVEAFSLTTCAQLCFNARQELAYNIRRVGSQYSIYIPAVGVYSCPCYYYPNRSGGSGRASYVVAADLRSGQMTADHWIKRGTALLMSLDH